MLHLQQVPSVGVRVQYGGHQLTNSGASHDNFDELFGGETILADGNLDLNSSPSKLFLSPLLPSALHSTLYPTPHLTLPITLNSLHSPLCPSPSTTYIPQSHLSQQYVTSSQLNVFGPHFREPSSKEPTANAKGNNQNNEQREDTGKANCSTQHSPADPVGISVVHHSADAVGISMMHHSADAVGINVVLMHKPRGSKGIWFPIEQGDLIRVTKGKGKRLKLEIFTSVAIAHDMRILLVDGDQVLPYGSQSGLAVEAIRSSPSKSSSHAGQVATEVSLKLSRLSRKLSIVVHAETTGSTPYKLQAQSIEFSAHNNGKENGIPCTVPIKSELKKARTHATPPSSPSCVSDKSPVVPTCPLHSISSPNAYASLDPSPPVAERGCAPNQVCPISPSPLILTASPVLPISPLYYHLDPHQPAQPTLFTFKYENLSSTEQYHSLYDHTPMPYSPPLTYPLLSSIQYSPHSNPYTPATHPEREEIDQRKRKLFSELDDETLPVKSQPITKIEGMRLYQCSTD